MYNCFLTFVYFEAKFQQKADEQYDYDARQYMYILSKTVTNTNVNWHENFLILNPVTHIFLFK